MKHGTRLATHDGTAVVTGGHAPWDAAGWMWDLTVAHDHDFYVRALTTAILVHNCRIPDRVRAVAPLEKSARYIERPNSAWEGQS